MKGNFHVQFLGEGVAATSPPYPTLGGHPPRSTRPGIPALTPEFLTPEFPVMLARVTPVPFCKALYDTPLSVIVRRRRSEIEAI